PRCASWWLSWRSCCATGSGATDGRYTPEQRHLPDPLMDRQEHSALGTYFTRFEWRKETRMLHQEKKHQESTIGGKMRSVALVAALGLAALLRATARGGRTGPDRAAVPPLGGWHPSPGTAGLCERVDIGPTAPP